MTPVAGTCAATFGKAGILNSTNNLKEYALLRIRTIGWGQALSKLQ